VNGATTTHGAPKPAIRVRHLWHRFGRNEVLRDVSFDVHEGEIFGFIGPNGAGKTTTIRVMATLLEPMAGKVEIDGWDVTIDPQNVRKVIGYMPDHAGVYERVTVREYLEFFADAYKVPTAGTTYAVVDAVMELTDLTKLRDKLVATMSKGMKQRLQLARTLLHDPKVLILDEPASDLDPRARIEIRDLLVELRGMGKTIFLSSHILTELADVCTSVAILERGRLVVSGPISDIARRLEAAQAAQAQAEAQAAANAGIAEAHGIAPPGIPPMPLPPGAPGAYAPGPFARPFDGTTPDIAMPEGWGPHDAQTVAAAAATRPAAPVPVGPTRNVRIKALASGDAVYAALVSMHGIQSVSPGPAGAVVVKYTGDDQTVAAIVRTLVTAGVPVVGVEPERNELERIFMEVTKGEVQ
jgi:ABC-2 type transport system ATP-binding protein